MDSSSYGRFSREAREILQFQAKSPISLTKRKDKKKFGKNPKICKIIPKKE
jgi:hypothetical protein